MESFIFHLQLFVYNYCQSYVFLSQLMPYSSHHTLKNSKYKDSWSLTQKIKYFLKGNDGRISQVIPTQNKSRKTRSSPRGYLQKMQSVSYCRKMLQVRNCEHNWYAIHTLQLKRVHLGPIISCMTYIVWPLFDHNIVCTLVHVNIVLICETPIRQLTQKGTYISIKEISTGL